MIHEIKECPKCKVAPKDVTRCFLGYVVVCDSCNINIPFPPARGEVDAVVSWNKFCEEVK